MSSGEEDQNRSARSSNKKRRRANACDMCRKKKMKCDGRQPDTGKCTSCSDYNWDCTSISEASKKYATGYVEALKTKIERLEELVKRLAPGQDFTAEVGYKLTQLNWMNLGVLGGVSKNVSKTALEPQSPSMFVFGAASNPAESHTTPSSASVSSNVFASAGPEHAPPTVSLPDEEQLSDDDGESNIRSKLWRLPSLTKVYTESNYFGRSSWFGTLNTVLSMCKTLCPDVDLESFFRTPDNWENPVWIDNYRVVGGPTPPPLSFPEPALMEELVDLYFSNVNILAPVLHRASFDASRVRGLHLKDRAFGGVVLIVCAIGSRFSMNPNVLLDGEKTWHSAGWKWYAQASVFDTVHLDIPTTHLAYLQMTYLAGIYIFSISTFYGWTLAGLGIKIALDVGAHKRAAYSPVPTLEDELYKRVFWALVHLDRLISSTLGRPCSIQEEDFDLEMPVCCDDKYLTRRDGQEFAQQPSDEPSVMAYFIWSLKLSQIQGLAARTIYASTKARAHYGFKGEEWITRTIAHLDSLLNNWNSTVPAHLRYDSANTNETFHVQSLHLYLQYHELQLMIHRPFLSLSYPAPLPHVPLAICTNSARSLVRLMANFYELKKHTMGLYHGGAWHWHVAMVLLVGIGNARLHKVSFDRKRAMADLDLMQALLHKENDRWRWAPRHRYLIRMLKVMGEVEDDEPAQQRKRPYEEDAAASTQTEPEPPGQVSSAVVLRSFNGIGWNAFSPFGENGAPGGVGMPQSNGAVLGNIDFGALFGFGDPGPPDMRAYASPPVNSVSTAGTSLGGFGQEGWSQPGFDFAVPGPSERQWTAPPGTEYSEADGGTFKAGERGHQ